jgi:nitrous oxidase accessory protein
LRLLSFILCIALGICAINRGYCAQHIVNPHDNLQQLLDNSQDGDEILLQPGRYLGQFYIRHSIILRGTEQTVIDAQGKGNALELLAPNIKIQQLTIVNWGHNLTAQNAGIYANKIADGAVIQDNTLSGAGFGMWLQNLSGIQVINNRVKGDVTLRSADRGNGIQLSSITQALVEHNHISETRDGLYVISSKNNVIRDNQMHDLRYGIHYMYSYSNDVLNNLAYQTRACYALMSSKYLQVKGNECYDSEDYGMLMNFITYSDITDNIIQRIWTKPEHQAMGREGKGIFVYNSGYNTIARNLVDTAEIGIHLTAGSEQVKIYGNSFIHNRVQVKYVSNKEQQWSMNQRGNFWSNYLGWDLDHDQIGDVAFEPNDGIDKLAWQYPELKMIMDSPAIIILRWIQRQFPVLKPAGVKDSYPLMQAPHSTKRQQEVK